MLCIVSCCEETRPSSSRWRRKVGSPAPQRIAGTRYPGRAVGRSTLWTRNSSESRVQLRVGGGRGHSLPAAYSTSYARIRGVRMGRVGFGTSPEVLPPDRRWTRARPGDGSHLDPLLHEHVEPAGAVASGSPGSKSW